jgi:hypothetical protein
VGLEFAEWYTPYPSLTRNLPEGFYLEENTIFGMDFLYYGHEIGPFHFENQILITKDGPRSFYAPPNTPRVLPKGLTIKRRGKTEVYSPEVRLTQEQGIPI